LRHGGSVLAQVVLLVAVTLPGCGQQAPSWDKLLASKITGQYPEYRVRVSSPGWLHVERPGLAGQTVEVEPIAQHCRRGARDCSDAVEQMLLVLRDP
jgi:hypothetical protein